MPFKAATRLKVESLLSPRIKSNDGLGRPLVTFVNLVTYISVVFFVVVVDTA